jgi:hypothetical protein
MVMTKENRSTWSETCPSATLFTTNPTRNDLGEKSDLRGERPATNCLSQGNLKNVSIQYNTSILKHREDSLSHL